MSLQILQIIGSNIKLIRKEKGVKGDSLGKAIKKTRALVSMIENGQIDIKISVLVKICETLGVTVKCSRKINKVNRLVYNIEITHSIFTVLKGIIKTIKPINCSVLWVSCFVCSRLWVRSQETFAQHRFLRTFV